jgi:transcription factor E2F7/8
LGENCRRFLKLFGAKSDNPQEHDIINVDDCISVMGIQRRRIYDFINILESLEIMKRLKKNEYEIKPASDI